MSFELTEVTECTCAHVNIREESHGDEKVLAVDLAFELEGSNDLLDLFDKQIRPTLYFNRAAENGQEPLPEMLTILPNLRCAGLPERMPFGGADKHAGYRLTVDYGLGPDRSDVDLTECVVGKKWFEVKEGGSAKLGFRVSYAGEALHDVMVRGTLVGLKGQKAFVKLLAPAVVQLVKGSGRVSKAQPGDDEDLLGDDEDDEGGDELTPESALAGAVAAG